MSQKSFSWQPTERTILYIRVANELWYTTMLNGERRYDLISLGLSTHNAEPGKILSFTFFYINVAFGSV